MEAADEEQIHHLPPQVDEISQYSSDGALDINKQPALKKATGNWRACFLILGAEFSECLAFYGISKNLATYLTTVLHESNVDAARNVSTWGGSCFFTPHIGAFLADTYWGKYWTGMLTLTVSASLPMLMGSSYNIGIHHVTVYVGLYLIALGNGGIKPCTSAFGADQFDGADSEERVTKSSYFNWYNFAVNTGSVLSGILLVWVQDNIGWAVGFAIPTVLMVFSLSIFVAGRKVYRYKKLGGSPLTRISQVVVATLRNYRLVLPDDCSALHETPEANYKIPHTCQFRMGSPQLQLAEPEHERFFDKAAILAPSSGQNEAGPLTSPWRLCTVSQVEELKMLLRMFPIWASMVLFFTVDAQMSSTFIEQGMTMDNRVGPFTVPPASIATFDVITVIICIPLYDRVLVPLARRATGKDRGLSQLQRLGVGLMLSFVAMVYAALVETKRLEMAKAGGKLNIMWQAPSFAVLGLGDVFTAIGILEFFYDQSPSCMKSMGTALSQLAVAAGSYLNSALIGVVAKTTTRGGAPEWIPDNLNEGHLDYFFWMMASLSLVNLLYFLLCSMRYRGNNTSL
ncbi:hypothetical protein EJB05_42142 [Eragrostis curvula]|uniref:Major facilitator superfamily (MFS) profile domain-containing protein n=1 Tax=Eragrostis curvula TaxID=38414 RepID=A0A5J9TBF7_9POAL|nr:hypothetical protein EJB05_42142 [Eragrostis curvula]